MVAVTSMSRTATAIDCASVKTSRNERARRPHDWTCSAKLLSWHMTEFPAGCTCEFTILRIERYLLATLSPGESLAIAEHIEACVSCAQRLVLFESPGRRPAHRGR